MYMFIYLIYKGDSRVGALVAAWFPPCSWGFTSETSGIDPWDRGLQGPGDKGLAHKGPGGPYGPGPQRPRRAHKGPRGPQGPSPQGPRGPGEKGDPGG